MDVLERVLLVNTAIAAPLHFQHETSGSKTPVTQWRRVLVANNAAAEPLPSSSIAGNKELA